MSYGFLRVATASPAVKVADTGANADAIIQCAAQACSNGAQLVVFPELSITAYTCSDLFQQRTLQEEALESLKYIARQTSGLSALILVGLPLPFNGSLYNVAALLHQGKIVALVPKTFVPTYGEFYERRQFTPAFDGIQSIYIDRDNPQVPFGTSILIKDSANPLFTLACEICEDVWVPLSPSTKAALSGATVIANLSASNEIIGKAAYRKLLISSQSAKLCCGYVYANAGNGESTTDMVFSAHNLIAENGSILAESPLFSSGLTYADIDLERIDQERKKTTTFADTVSKIDAKDFLTISLPLNTQKHPVDEGSSLIRFVDAHPFVPESAAERSQRCQAVIELQAQGLAKRLIHTNCQCAVIGLSGGLDSTLALLVTIRAFKLCGIDTKRILTVTMPCFGTTERTLSNAHILAQEGQVTLAEIPITNAVLQHFKDIGQSSSTHDVTFENGQARERTQVLMDLANKNGGMVIGTGDLSEQALGWATYNGDHMSMYGVNGSIPKTLVRHLVQWFSDDAKGKGQEKLSQVLTSILETPVSPELLPPTAAGKIAQKTESLVGPYELHDFFLYYVLRFGFTPEKIYYLAQKAFIDQPKEKGIKPLYSKAVIKQWLISFYKRFFAQQFKRSCMPDGAKVGTVNLSPRGDWRMPSDAVSRQWVQRAEKL